MNIEEHKNTGQAEAYIEGLPMWANKKNSLKDIRCFLEAMGNPDEKMKLIHVAGTNGKGSVCAYLQSILTQAGCRTASFTSPHLIHLEERFSICGKQVEAEEFEKSFKRVRRAADAMGEQGFCHPTYFEFLFYMAMDLFSRMNAEYVILETGLGGRLDVTNVIRHPLACVITSISMDHMAYLGNTLKQIASEKAGIIKKGVPVICDANGAEPRAVVEEKAFEMGAPCVCVLPSDYRIEAFGPSSISAEFILGDGTCLQVKIPSAAEYQVMNALLSVRTAEALKLPFISAEHIKMGLESMYWPGRMEEIYPGVWLDGAHNEGGIQAFIQTAVRMCRDQNKRAYLLFSAVSDKEHEKMIKEVCQFLPLDGITVVQMGSLRGTKSTTLVSEFLQETDCPTEAWPDTKTAMEHALARMDDEHLLFCVGSLYLMGEIKAL